MSLTLKGAKMSSLKDKIEAKAAVQVAKPKKVVKVVLGAVKSVVKRKK